MTKSIWGALIEGHRFDLQDWADALQKQFDPWVELYDAQSVLRSTSFDELTSAEQVHDRALAYIDRLNGAFAVSHNAKPLSLGGVVEITHDGQRKIFKFAQFSAEGRSHARAVAQVIGPDGKPVVQPPTPSEVQRWCGSAERDEWLDDALIYFAKSDWFDNYKALECLFGRAGGEDKFMALGWESKSEVQRLKRTANWARHARRKFNPPTDPMSMKEARELLGRLIRRALTEAV
jgi:hypothetical protein